MKTDITKNRYRLLWLTALMLIIIQVNWASRQFLILAPGVSLRLDESVVIQGGKHDSKGLFLVTAVYAELANPLTLLYALFDPSTNIVHEQSNIMGQDDEATRQLEASMKDSIGLAGYLALDALGYDVHVIKGVRVDMLDENSPFWGKLTVGDVITGVNGVDTTSPQKLRNLLVKHRVGDLLTLEVNRGERPLKYTGRLISNQSGEASLGVSFSQQMDYHFPISVEIDAGDIKGSSGGLMFALEVYDQLTKGDLTSGKIIAGTGTLERNGRVLAVSGVKQKVLSAKRWGADYFIAPKENADEARRYSGSMKIISVSTFDECIRILTNA